MTVKKMVAIGGVPGTGKSTLVKEFMKNVASDWEAKKLGPTLEMEISDSASVAIFGKYEEGQMFPGTDRLSLACQPKFTEYLSSEDAVELVVFEGDRLFNSSFLNAVIEKGIDLEIIILNTDSVMLQERYKQRGSEQSEKFIRGRETKYEKILSSFEFMPYITEFPHLNEQDTETIVNHIKNFLGE